MASTWISTIILGTPVVTAALGPQYANLGILAGVSSFLFQLPLMLAGLEANRYLREEAAQEQEEAAEKQRRQKGPPTVDGKPAGGVGKGSAAQPPAQGPCAGDSGGCEETRQRRRHQQQRAQPQAVRCCCSSSRGRAAGRGDGRFEIGQAVLPVRLQEKAAPCPVGSTMAGHLTISPRAPAPDGDADDLETGPVEGASTRGEPAAAPGSTSPEVPCCCVSHCGIGSADGGGEVGRPAADGDVPGCTLQHPLTCGQDGGGGGTGKAAVSRDGGPLRGRRRRVACARAAARIGWRLLHNHVMWAIAVGFLLSLTTLGYKYLDPGTPQQPNSQFVEPTGFIDMTLSWLGRCTQPLALFATGMFCHQWMTAFMRECRGTCAAVALQWLAKMCAYMVVKLVMVPALAVGCAHVTGLEGAQGRAAVLIGALPVSLVAFTVGQGFGVGQPELAANVVLGTLLLIPTTIAWSSFMDAVGLYTVP